MAAIYGTGAAIGFTPQQVDQMSIWQFNAAVAGWVKANTASKESLTEEQKDDLLDWIERDAEPELMAPGYRYDTVTKLVDGLLVTSIDSGGGILTAAFTSLSSQGFRDLGEPGDDQTYGQPQSG